MSFTRRVLLIAVVGLGLGLSGVAPRAGAQPAAPFSPAVTYRMLTARGAGLPPKVPLTFSMDGQYLAVGGSVIAVEHMVDMGPIYCDNNKIGTRVAFHPDGKHVLLNSNPLTLWELPNGPPAAQDVFPVSGRAMKPESNRSYKPAPLPGAPREMAGNGLSVAPDGETYVVAGYKTVEKRSMKTGELLGSAELAIVGQPVRIFHLGKSGDILIAPLLQNQEMQVWDGKGIVTTRLTEPKPPRPGLSRNNSNRSLGLSPDGSIAYEMVYLQDIGKDRNFLGNYSWVYVWNLKAGTAKQLPGFHEGWAVALLPDMSGFVVGSLAGRIEIRDMSNKVLEVVVPGERERVGVGRIEDLTVSPDGKTIAACMVSVHGSVVTLFRRGAKPFTVTPTGDSFPAVVGTRWIYEVQNSTAASKNLPQLAYAAAAEVIGADRCIRIDWYHPTPNNFGGQLGWGKDPRESFWYALRPDGVYLVGKGKEYINRPPQLFPTPLTESKPQLTKFETFSDIGAGYPGEVTTHVSKVNDAVGVPIDPKLNAARIDRITVIGGGRNSESLWFAKGFGLVKWSRSNGETMLLKEYLPPK